MRTFAILWPTITLAALSFVVIVRVAVASAQSAYDAAMDNMTI